MSAEGLKADEPLAREGLFRGTWCSFSNCTIAGVRTRFGSRLSRPNQAKSKRSRFITLFQVVTKSCTNFSLESLHA
jgi:hypothetical protein